MRKNVKHSMLVIVLVAFLFIQLTNAQGQTSTTLRPSSDPKIEKAVIEGTTDKKIKREQFPTQDEKHKPVLLPQPSSKITKPQGTDAKQGTSSQEQSTRAQTGTESALQCSWTLLLVNEVGGFYLDSYGVPCLGCTISTNLSQSSPGILGFSKNPSGPWTETLTISTTLNFSGNGTSEIFYIKGLIAGPSTVHGQNFWSSTDIDFQVMPCACPDIPILP